MHGAGLANFVLSPPRAAVLVELRSSFGAELDIFATLAHASGAGYLWASVAAQPKVTAERSTLRARGFRAGVCFRK